MLRQCNIIKLNNIFFLINKRPVFAGHKTQVNKIEYKKNQTKMKMKIQCRQEMNEWFEWINSYKMQTWIILFELNPGQETEWREKVWKDDVGNDVNIHSIQIITIRLLNISFLHFCMCIFGCIFSALVAKQNFFFLVLKKIFSFYQREQTNPLLKKNTSTYIWWWWSWSF